MTAKELAERYERVQEDVELACLKAGRARESVELLAVSKFQPVDAIKDAAALGQLYFGENYIQEALAKREELSGLPWAASLKWDMIGHLQTRKAALAAGAFNLLHTLDSLKLAAALEKRLQATGGFQNALIEVNIGEEPQKTGVLPNDVESMARSVLAQASRLRILGLMCMPPFTACGERARPYFGKLRRIRDKLEKLLGIRLPILSMGMSGDFMIAIEEGATIIRVGTAIFGERARA